MKLLMRGELLQTIIKTHCLKGAKKKRSVNIAIAAFPCSRPHDAGYSRLNETSCSMMPSDMIRFLWCLLQSLQTLPSWKFLLLEHWPSTTLALQVCIRLSNIFAPTQLLGPRGKNHTAIYTAASVGSWPLTLHRNHLHTPQPALPYIPHRSYLVSAPLPNPSFPCLFILP